MGSGKNALYRFSAEYTITILLQCKQVVLL